MRKVLCLLSLFVVIALLCAPMAGCLNREGLPVYTVSESQTLAALTMKRAQGQLLTPDEQMLYDNLVQKGINDSHGVDWNGVLNVLLGGLTGILGGAGLQRGLRGPAKPMDPLMAATLKRIANDVQEGRTILSPAPKVGPGG